MPDEPELGPGAAPVKVDKPGRIPKREVRPVTQPAQTKGIVQGPAEPPRPTFKERLKTRYESHKQERAIAKTPEARAKRIEERKASVKLTGQELDLRSQERQQRIRGYKESRTGHAVALAARTARPAAETFRRAERRGLRIDPRTAYGTGLTGFSAQQRYGAPRPGLSTPQVSPIGMQIHTMRSIGSGGVTAGYEPQRVERQPIPRGTIKSYWSKKVKSLAKANVRKYGPDEGIARTKQLAEELGWKMQ